MFGGLRGETWPREEGQAGELLLVGGVERGGGRSGRRGGGRRCGGANELT